MNLIKSILFAALAFASTAFAQTPVPATFIKGDLSIRYNTRANADGLPKEGQTDVYTLNVNVSNSAIFKGTIEQKPFIRNTISANQLGSLNYNIDLAIVNPANVTQTRDVGKLTGTVPVSERNVYDFSAGKLNLAVFSMGTAKGFETKFTGQALGKPPAKSQSVTQQAMNMMKNVGGKTVAITMTKYDVMEFVDHAIASGPVQAYPDVKVSGKMYYDYSRNAWYLQNIAVTYPVDDAQGRRIAVDVLSGNIRWVEAANRKATGEGEYQFDIRLNEPAPNEAAAFSGVQDESAFFAVDTSVASLTGTMKYKDTIQAERVLSSVVKVDLVGNKLTKNQIIYLAKLLFMTSVVPLNAE